MFKFLDVSGAVMWMRLRELSLQTVSVGQAWGHGGPARRPIVKTERSEEIKDIGQRRNPANNWLNQQYQSEVSLCFSMAR